MSKKYLIIGTGGTGGPVGAYLARAGRDVTFIARGAHLARMQEEGLRLERPQGSFVIHPVQACTMEDYADTPDVIFVCVKGYSLDEARTLIQRVAGSHTVVIPILNIYGTGGRLQEKLPGLLVTDGCIYVSARISAPGCIQMNWDGLRVVFGPRSPEQMQPVLKEIAEDLQRSGITAVLSDHIQKDALVKFSYVSPAGACGLSYNVTAGGMQKEGEARECFIALIQEIEALGEAMGIRFAEDLVGRNLAILDDLPEDSTTSMQRDIARGGPSEIDGLIYEVVRMAKKHGITVPEYERIAVQMRSRGL